MPATSTMASRWGPPERLATISFVALLTFVAALQISIAAASLALGATLVAWLTWTLSTHRAFEAPTFFVPLVAYGAWTLVSALFSDNPTAGLEDSKQLVLLLIVPAVYALARGRRANAVMDVIITVGALTAVVGIVQYGILHYDNLGKRPQGTLTHYMTYSGVLMLVIGAAAARLMYQQQNRLWTALVMPALLVALALTFTRSAWVGAFGGLATLALLKDRRLLALAPVLVVLAVAVAPDRVASRAYSMFDLNDPTNRDRVAMLRTGARMIADHPLTGVGPDQIKVLYAQYRDPMAVQPINFHLHNVPVQIAAERGLPALGIWIWFVVAAAVQCWRLLHHEQARPLAAAALAAIVAMLGAGMFEYNFGDSEFLMLLLVLITLPAAAVLPDDLESAA